MEWRQKRQVLLPRSGQQHPRTMQRWPGMVCWSCGGLEHLKDIYGASVVALSNAAVDVMRQLLRLLKADSWGGMG